MILPEKGTIHTKTGKVIIRQSLKTCMIPGCNNHIPDYGYQKYCTDPKCINSRKTKKKQKKYYTYDASINVTIPKNKKLINSIINIQCSAKGKHGRCKHTFTVPYTANRTTYPRYCEEHRNIYKRQRWENGNIR